MRRNNLLARRALLVLALCSSGLLFSACDETEAGGVGASTGLPPIFASPYTDPTDTGLGSVHWVGNPRW